MSSEHIFETFSRQWDAGQAEFILSTSGSTGPPKPFALLREKIKWSCARTADFLDVQPGDRIFCCLPTDKVSGFMQLARAAVWGIGISIAKPSANPMLEYSVAENCSIISITPMQLFEIIDHPKSLEKFQTFKKVLIGGAEINFDPHAQKLHPILYQTYGMTETYSHVAYRLLDGNNELYRTVAFTEIKTGDDDRLEIKNFLTDEQWLKTNDRAQILEDGSFRFLGRGDILINSGGIKIDPAEIESQISIHYKLAPNSLICLGLPDPRLGQKLSLRVLNKYAHMDWDLGFLPVHQRPRHIEFVDEIPLTETGKLKRS